jgi:hypothetical protein
MITAAAVMIRMKNTMKNSELAVFGSAMTSGFRGSCPASGDDTDDTTVGAG